MLKLHDSTGGYLLFISDKEREIKLQLKAS